MNKARRLFRLFASGRDPAPDVDEELALHIALRAEELARQGLGPEEARQAALRSFGNLATTRRILMASAARQAHVRRWSERLMDLGRNASQAVRSLRRMPLLAFGAVAAFALGIGTTTTMFSIGHAVLADLPVPEPDRLLQIVGVDRSRAAGNLPLRLAEFLELRARQETMTGVAVWVDEGLHLGDGKTAAERVSGVRASAGMFEIVGVRPARGREFVPADQVPGAEPVVILGDRLWRDRFQADSAVLGTVIRINGHPTTIIGVMPPKFAFPSSAEAWTPIVGDRLTAARDTTPRFVGVARLRNGRTIDQARAEVGRIGHELIRARAGKLDRESLSARPFAEFMVGPEARLRFYAMFLVVSSVLLIACANVANLLLARAVTRGREIAVRAALGSSRWGLIRSLLLEALLLAAVGGALGTGLAEVAVKTFGDAVAFELPYWAKLEVDWVVLGFVFVAVLLSALVTGVAPGRKASLVRPAQVLRGAVRGPAGLRLGPVSRELLVLQVALATSLLVMSALMVKGALARLGRSPVASPEEIAVARIELDGERYPTDLEQSRVTTEILARLGELPGVVAVAAGTATPGYGGPSLPFALPGMAPDEPDLPTAPVSAVSPGFFAAFGIPLLEGREFTPNDRSGTPRVALVTRSLADRHLAGRSPIGALIRVAGPGQPFDPNRVTPQAVEIVGVVGEVESIEGASLDRGGIFLPLNQVGDARIAFGVRARDDPAEVLPRLREIVLAVDRDLPVFQDARLVDEYARSTAGERVFTILFASFGLSGLVLASVGLFAMVAFGVRQRVRETGIRLALGEPTRSIAWRLCRGGIVRVGVGLASGLAIAYLGSPALGAVLFETSPRDPAVYAAVGGAIAMVALAAILAPTLSAVRASPIEALRSE